MIIFYVESKNGNYSSENGDRRFDKLTGQKVFDFLNSEAGKGRRFMKVNDDGELNKVYVEVPREQVRAIRKDERHKQYLSDCRNASGFIVVSIYDTELCREDCSSGEELIADENAYELSSHEGEEFIYVMEGVVEIAYGKKKHVIEAGDSIYYDSIVPHHVHGFEGQAARILAVVYTPI